MRRVVCAYSALVLVACSSSEPPSRSPDPTEHEAAAPSTVTPSTVAPSTAPVAPTVAPSIVEGPRIVFVPADEGDVSTQVAALVLRAREEGRAPLVYVGATWCEPCQYFHAAALRGDLDGELPPLLLLEFDRDRDGERLDAAGYSSRMIPLFVVPEDDGRPSDARIEGSIHGPGSPAQIVPRLRAILP